MTQFKLTKGGIRVPVVSPPASVGTVVPHMQMVDIDTPPLTTAEYAKGVAMRSLWSKGRNSWPDKQDRMYADSGHQVVNPEVMKQVLNEHFGELNPEPEFEALTLTEFARIYRELTGAVRWTNDELYKFRVYEAAIHAKLKKDLSK